MFIAVVATYFFVYWLPLSLIPGVHDVPFLPSIISLILAVLIGVFIWRKTANLSGSLASSILMGGVIVGSISFIAGFVGPIIFTPGSNQGPLLGIFFTGPIGFIVGLIAGALYWWLRLPKKR
jgi:hypothetical protein